MIVARAPLRISFAGGGTDLPHFYREHPGRVITTAIDKYVFIVVNRTPFIDMVSVRYSRTETVRSPAELHHTRVRAALVETGISSNIEIGSFASLPARIGLGSSSSFTVALLAALDACRGQSAGPQRLAELACRLEIQVLGEPIGKQDQYAAAFGGLHVFEFLPDESVGVRPVPLTNALRRKLDHHLLMFFSGITRDASTILREQAATTRQRLDTLRRMAELVPVFEAELLQGNIRGLAEILHENWLHKRSLCELISNDALDTLYDAGRQAGAWGGKLLGAGGGGCLLFLAPPDAHDAVRAAVQRAAGQCGLEEFREVPISLAQAGCQIVFHGTQEH